jgi:tRNA pseudouridine38-40 synthase
MNVDEPGRPFGDAGLVRVRLDIAYDGTAFAGWAVQPEQRTVQQVLQDALSMILRAPGLALTVAGRTDAGVHARGQVAHFDVAVRRWHELRATLLRRLAAVLALDVRVTAITEVSMDFDARFSALWRRYVYRATDAEVGNDPLRRFDTLAWPRTLDTDAMQAAARGLVGEHNFAAFCRRREGSTTIRTLQSLDIRRSGDEINWTVQADAFCYSMVRSLVGALLAVGDGRRRPDWPASLLSARSRADDVTVAPAHGLTLVEVGYPPADELAARAALTRRRRDGVVLERRPPSVQVGLT